MFESIKNIFKKTKKRELLKPSSKDAAKERLHLVLMQDRANVSADFLDLMRREIIEVIKKYIDIDEEAIDVRLTNETNEDGEQGAPALYANIPIINIKDETRRLSKTNQENKLNTQPPKQDEDINLEVNKNIEEDINQEDNMSPNNNSENIEKGVKEADKEIKDENIKINDNQEGPIQEDVAETNSMSEKNVQINNDKIENDNEKMYKSKEMDKNQIDENQVDKSEQSQLEDTTETDESNMQSDTHVSDTQLQKDNVEEQKNIKEEKENEK